MTTALDAAIASPVTETASRRQVRGSVLLLAGRGISLALNFGTQILTVRYLAKGDYGLFAFALVLAETAAIVVAGGLDKSLARLAPIYHERRDFANLRGALAGSTLTMLALGCAVVLAAVIGGERLADGLKLPTDAVPLLCVFAGLAPIAALDSLAVAMFSAFAEAKFIFFRRHLLGPGLKLAAVLFVAALGGSTLALATAQVAAAGLGLACNATLLWQLLRREGVLVAVRRELPGDAIAANHATHRTARAVPLRWPIREFLRFSLPLLFVDVIYLARTSLVVVAIEWLGTSDGVADFRAVLPLARLNEVVFLTFSTLFLPLASRLFAQGNWRQMEAIRGRTSAWVTVLSFPLFAICVLAGRPLATLLFGESYAEAGVVLGWLALGYYVEAVFGFSQQCLKVIGAMRAIVLVELAMSVLTLALCCVSIPRWGAVGAAASVCGIMLVQSLINALVLRCTEVAVRREPPGFAATNGPTPDGSLPVAVLACVLAIVVAAAIWSPSLWLAGLCVGPLWLFLFVVGRQRLDAAEMFPEVARVRVLRWLFHA